MRLTDSQYRNLKIVLALVFALIVAAGAWSTRNIDSQTGLPVHHAAATRYEDGTTVQPDGTATCAAGALCDDRTLTVAGCTYHADGSGRCGTEIIPPLEEYDADFCNDIDPQATVITLCRKG